MWYACMHVCFHVHVCLCRARGGSRSSQEGNEEEDEEEEEEEEEEEAVVVGEEGEGEGRRKGKRKRHRVAAEKGEKQRKSRRPRKPPVLKQRQNLCAISRSLTPPPSPPLSSPLLPGAQPAGLLPLPSSRLAEGNDCQQLSLLPSSWRHCKFTIVCF